MYKIILILILISALFLVNFSAFADDKEHAESEHKTSPVISLSKETRKALSKEMLSIQDHMRKLIPAISYGKWDTIAKAGEEIKGSYILKQDLTKEQIEELHRALPEGFQQLDNEFHETAGRLAHAAKEQDMQLVSFYYYRLVESCMKCHSAYVTHKFPGFKKEQESHSHH